MTRPEPPARRRSGRRIAVAASLTLVASFLGFDTIAAQGDVTPPTITTDVSGPLGNNGWYTGDVTVTFTVDDPESAVMVTGCGVTLITSDTSSVTLECEATSDGGTSTDSVTVKRDATAPSANADASPAAVNGWNSTDVAVEFSGSDSLSGVAFCSSTVTLTSEAAGQSAFGSCTDNAGNVSSSAGVSNINIDKSHPEVAPTVGPDPLRVGDVPIVAANATDNLSGVASTSCGSVDTSTAGFFLLECSATDNAGNFAATTIDYEVQNIPTCEGQPATIIGTEGNDVIRGTEGDDVIVGLGGNDVIRGLGGNDFICGYDGRDRLFGGPGDDILHGGEKNDILKGDQGADWLFGNQGRDRLTGGSGPDLLVGGSGTKDRLNGKGGFDTCIDPQGATIRDNCEA